jgi:catechol 2,3-dioxygenase-like lactoylglutathione lyase family enzyme
MVQGFDNIGVSVTDLQRSVAFYEGLGLREVYRNERGVLMSADMLGSFCSRPGRWIRPPSVDNSGYFKILPELITSALRSAM